MPTLSKGRSLGEVAEIIHAAAVLGPAAWGREPMPEAHMAADIEDRLKSQLVRLFQILHQRKIPYVLVGGIAMLTYIEGRNTKDVDLVMSVDSLSAIPEIVISDRNGEFACGKFDDLQIDFLLTDNPLFKLVQQKHATIHRFLEMDIRCATIEGLILLKLFALPWLYRQGGKRKDFPLRSGHRHSLPEGSAEYRTIAWPNQTVYRSGPVSGIEKHRLGHPTAGRTGGPSEEKAREVAVLRTIGLKSRGNCGPRLDSSPPKPSAEAPFSSNRHRFDLKRRA